MYKDLTMVHRYQTGSGFNLSGLTNALGKVADVAGKVANNKGVQAIAKTGLEVGANVAGQQIANKLAERNYNDAAKVVDSYSRDFKVTDLSQSGQNIGTSFEAEKQKIKDMFNNGEINKTQALNLYAKLKAQSGSGVNKLKKEALKNMKKGNYYAYESNQKGGLGPIAVAGAAAGLGLLGAIAGGLLGPVFEQISKKHIADKI